MPSPLRPWTDHACLLTGGQVIMMWLSKYREMAPGADLILRAPSWLMTTCASSTSGHLGHQAVRVTGPAGWVRCAARQSPVTSAGCGNGGTGTCRPASFALSRLRVYLSLLYEYHPFLCVSWCEKKECQAGLVLGSYARLQGARFTGMDGSCFPRPATSWQCFVLVTVMGTSM